MKKNLRIVTPKAIVNYPYLNVMDTAFKQNTYKATEVYILKSEATKIMEVLEKELDENYNKLLLKNKDLKKVLPWEEKGDYLLFKNKFKSQFKPKQVKQINNKFEEVDLEITPGSELKFSLSYNIYNMLGKVGISFYIDALQIIEIKDNFNINLGNKEKSFSDYGFDLTEEELVDDLEDLGFEIEEETITDEIDTSVDEFEDF